MPPCKTHEQYVQECEEKGYDLPVDRENNRYTGNTRKLLHACCEGHGEYPQTPVTHLRGHGCGECGKVSRTSKMTRSDDEYRHLCIERGLDLPVDRYVTSDAKIHFKCSIKAHSPYLQNPTTHLQMHGCGECAIERRRISSTKPFNQYVADCKEAHYDLPTDMDGGDYVDSKTKLLHTCAAGHGTYPQTPNCHLRGKGCPECGRSSGALLRTKTDSQYRKECALYGLDPPVDDPSNRYTGARDGIYHQCGQEHPPYKQAPECHLIGQRCPVCAGNAVRTDDEYRGLCKVYDMDLPVDSDNNRYVNNNTKLIHACQRGHPPYPQRPCGHLRGNGCPECGGTIKKDDAKYRTQCIERDLDLPVDRDDNRYARNRGKMWHKCRGCHAHYLQIPHHHLRGHGCSFCKKKSEGLLLAFIILLGYEVISGQRFLWTLDANGKYHGRQFDFYIPVLNLLVELDGPHHFGNIGYSRIEHSHQLTIDTYEKMVPALANGFHFMRISQPDFWNDPETMKPLIEQALEWHKTVPLGLSAVAKDPSIYTRHLELTDYYYENPEAVPDDDDEDEGGDEIDSDCDDIAE